MSTRHILIASLAGTGLLAAALALAAPARAPKDFDADIARNAQQLRDEGKKIFRSDTFGSEAFWGGQLRLHEAIAGEKHGGVGAGLSPRTALALGLKVDVDALPDGLKQQLAAGKVNLDDPATTLALLELDAVVGIKAWTGKDGRVQTMGIQCALCHSTVDDSFAPGIGRRLDGWANRDLDVGKIVALAPSLKPFTDLLGVDAPTVRKVLGSWGPGRYDATLDKDGKAFRPDGKQAGVLIPPAFGLAGVNLSTWTGMGSLTYWNAYVAGTQMHGSGRFHDPRLASKQRYPVSARSGSHELRPQQDRITPKLAALHYYQLSIPAPRPPAGSYDRAAFERGQRLFAGKAGCARCHVPPLYTEPGHNLHAPADIGIDAFQAERSPLRGYRTAPLAGLWTHTRGGFYHDGRFATLRDVVDHYDRHFKLNLTTAEKSDLVEHLKGL